MTKFIQLGKSIITPKSRPYLIAEIGVNHEGSLEKAKYLISLAKKGGADAVKFQTYKADTLASKDSPSYWDNNKESCSNQHELFKKYDCFEEADYVQLADYASKLNIDFTSTPFDDASVEFLDPIVSFFKISSSDITNIPFLIKIARKNKPIILSTGASNIEEIDLAVEAIKSNGCKQLALLHCVLNYPTLDHHAHLLMIKGLIRSYPDLIIGYSDHTLPDDSMTTLISSYLLGAVIIEKHFTCDKNLPGNDHYHSMDYKDLSKFVSLAEKIEKLLGSTDTKQAIESEELSRKNARRSIVMTKDVMNKEQLTEDSITYKRPGTGISPMYWNDVLKRRAAKDLKIDQILQWQDLESL